MQNLWPVNNVFSEGKIINFTQTKHPGIFWASFKNYSVVFQPISQRQYWAKKNGNKPVISFLCQHCAAQKQHSPYSKWIIRLRMDQQTTVDLSRLHFHQLVHLFTRVLQRAAFSSEKRLKEQKKRREKGQGVWSRALSLWHKSSLWSLEHNRASPLHPWARQQIIPIMQHVYDCRNPPWP